jgi:lysophospholipase L1-like esterase
VASGLTRRALFVLWSVGAAIVLLEVILRMGAFLVREEPTESSADPMALRVLALGDSWVYGAEAPKGQGFIDVVAQRLPELSNGRSVQMFNHGRNGSNTAHVALTAIDQMKRLQPELLIVLVGQNNASNFYRVAEVEERLGRIPPPDRLGDQLRVVKLARIVWANYQGSSEYLGDQDKEGRELPEIPDISTDEWGNPIATVGSLMQTAAAQDYLQRQVGSPPKPSGNRTTDLAWTLLYSAIRRDFVAAKAAEDALLTDRNWTTEASGASAPDVGGPEDVLARYALMRLSRERGDWRGVRYHGGALLDVEERNVLSDLGAAEASLLAGDWRRSRALLTASHNRLPGFLDTIDMAARFTPQARDAQVYEALEFQPIAAGLAHERARFLSMTFDYDGAAEARRDWLAEHPEDLAVAVDQASWLIEMGRPDEAATTLAASPLPETERSLPPEEKSPDRWRYTLARLSESGNRQQSIDAVARALKHAEADAALLDLATQVLSSHEACEELPEVAAKWYLARGDANGYAERLAPCMPSGEAAHHLAGLREEWGPLGDSASWTALVKAGHRPFALLYRDLDLVLDAATENGAQVLVLNYPNPSEDHVVLRDVIGDYSSTRAVHYLDLWSLFDARFSQSEWQEHLGPNGHCNAEGYRVMADAIIRFLRERRVLAGSG